MNYELRELSFGETIGRAVNLYLDNFLPLFLITVVGQIPMVFVMNWFTIEIVKAGGSQNALMSLMPVYFAGIIGVLFFAIALTGFSIKVIANRYLDKPADLGGSLSAILPLLPILLITSLLVGIACGIGFILLIIPGIIVAMGLSMITPIIVVEKMGPIDAMKRSWELTKKKKLHLFGLFFVGGLISSVPLRLVDGILQEVIIIPSAFSIEAVSNAVFTYSAVTCLLTSLFAPVVTCILVLAYFNLRVQKEGFDVEHLAQQFDGAEDFEK